MKLPVVLDSTFYVIISYCKYITRTDSLPTTVSDPGNYLENITTEIVKTKYVAEIQRIHRQCG